MPRPSPRAAAGAAGAFPVATYGLTHVALAVRDVGRSARFYEALLGAQLVYGSEAFAQLQTPGARDVIVLELAPDRAGRAGGVAHFGFRLTRATDIGAAVVAVTTAGGRVVERGEFVPGEPYVYAEDPDGYIIELWYELPTPVGCLGGARTGMTPRVARRAVLLAVALAVAGAGARMGAQDAVAHGKAVFERYVRLEHAFDPAIADLYADTAVIRTRRHYPTGEVRELTIPAPKYKELIRSMLPVARQRGDTSTYAKPTFTAEGDGVRITAERYSNLKKYTSPFSMLVRPGPAGTWLIVEEISESQP